MIDTDKFITKAQDIVAFTETEKGLQELEKKFAWSDEKLDEMLTLIEESEVVKGAKKTCTQLRTACANVKKEEKAPYLAAGKAIEDKYKEVITRIQAVEAPIDAAILRKKKADDEAAKKAQEAKDKAKDDEIAKLKAQLAAAGIDEDSTPTFEGAQITFTASNRTHYAAIKKLIGVKGYDKLLTDEHGNAYDLQVTVKRVPTS